MSHGSRVSFKVGDFMGQILRRRKRSEQERNTILIQLSDILVSTRFKEKLPKDVIARMDELFLEYRGKREARHLEAAIDIVEEMIRVYHAGKV